jgi:hypothetical protein
VFVRPVTVHEVELVVHVNVPVVEITLYHLISAPPSVAADHVTTIFVLRPIEVGVPGFPGVVDGTTVVEGVDVGLVPLALWAFTVNVYDVPFVNVGTVQVSGPCVHVQVFDPGLEVTV